MNYTVRLVSILCCLLVLKMIRIDRLLTNWLGQTNASIQQGLFLECGGIRPPLRIKSSRASACFGHEA